MKILKIASLFTLVALGSLGTSCAAAHMSHPISKMVKPWYQLASLGHPKVSPEDLWAYLEMEKPTDDTSLTDKDTVHSMCDVIKNMSAEKLRATFNKIRSNWREKWQFDITNKRFSSLFRCHQGQFSRWLRSEIDNQKICEVISRYLEGLVLYSFDLQTNLPPRGISTDQPSLLSNMMNTWSELALFGHHTASPQDLWRYLGQGDWTDDTALTDENTAVMMCAIIENMTIAELQSTFLTIQRDLKDWWNSNPIEDHSKDYSNTDSFCRTLCCTKDELSLWVEGEINSKKMCAVISRYLRGFVLYSYGLLTNLPSECEE